MRPRRLRAVNAVVDEGSGDLTSTINEPQLPSHAMRTETRPIGHQEDAPRQLPHDGPVLRPIRAFKSGHKRPGVDPQLRRRVLARVDEIYHLLHRPVPGGHVEREEQDEAADLLGGGVRVAQLRLGPGVRRPDVQREAVDAGLSGCFDLVGPFVLGLAVAYADLDSVRRQSINTRGRRVRGTSHVVREYLARHVLLHRTVLGPKFGDETLKMLLWLEVSCGLYLRA